MIVTTLAYIENNNEYLMLYRNKKENDINQGKWLGIGGKVKENESLDQAMKREVYEETGFKVINYKFKGMITFVNTICETEHIFIYIVCKYSGTIIECNEGTLKWIEKDNILNLNLWAGDKYFLEPLINNESKLINMKFIYNQDELIEVIDNNN
jgi:8-oxo-dGTP diphosphatase